MELIGERWAMLVLRELAYGPRRFSELKSDLTGISANVLTQRLIELEARGLVRKTRLPPPASVQVYEATDWGLQAVPVIASLGRWAARSPWHDPTLPMSHVSFIMSLQTLLSPELSRGIDSEDRISHGRNELLRPGSTRGGSMWSGASRRTVM